MRIEIPELCVVALVGVTGSGKSTFAATHFKPTEVLSSDYFRALVSDDENDQNATAAAFDTLYYVANKRLDRGLLTVIDATNVQKNARAAVLNLAKEQNCLAAAIVLDIPERVCRQRNEQRPDRDFGAHVISRQSQQLRGSIKSLRKEGFRYVYVLTEEDLSDVEIVRTKMWSDKKDEPGPFDIIGDVHGCYDELCALLEKLGYAVDKDNHRAAPPEGRTAVFVGDLCDRGPKNVDVLRLVMSMTGSGAAYCVAGNHDVKLLRKLKGSDVQLTHGLDVTVAELQAQPPEFVDEVIRFLDGLLSHYVFDNGKLVVSHAGLIEKYQGRASGRVRSFCLYGDTTGETDEYGLPVRLPWARDYRSAALVVYGHMAVPEVEMINNTVCIDTGCVFGGKLTGFRYPEKQIVQVPADKEYYAPIKPLGVQSPLVSNPSVPAGFSMSSSPFLPVNPTASSNRAASSNPTLSSCPSLSSRHRQDLPNLSPNPGAEAGLSSCHRQDLPTPVADDVLNIDDVTGRRRLFTRLRSNIAIEAENSAAALEVMSRFAADPHWLIYLPPTMSPCETSPLPGYLEHPAEAFAYYKKRGITQVVCEQKHMGSRAVIVLCRDREVAARRFHMTDGSRGIIHTRTGRHFFPDAQTEEALLARLDAQLTTSGFWTDFGTDWVCLDTELMPWSAKAQELLEKQYAPVGLAGRMGLSAAVESLVKADSLLADKGDMPELVARYEQREQALELYIQAYRRYCWDVTTLDDYRIAPFHLLATEGATHCDRTHLWHMDTIAQYIVGNDPIFMATNHLLVDLTDEASVSAGITWWEELTESGGEGMVVKPLNFIATRGNELTHRTKDEVFTHASVDGSQSPTVELTHRTKDEVFTHASVDDARSPTVELFQPAVKCRGREYLRIIYGPEYLLGGNLDRLKSRSLSKKRTLAINEFALGMESLERFVRGDPLYAVHECVFAVLALESEPVDPRL